MGQSDYVTSEIPLAAGNVHLGGGLTRVRLSAVRDSDRLLTVAVRHAVIQLR
jgi:hypothetical protein